MWHITNYQNHKVQFDFTAADRGYWDITQIISNNTIIANGYELMDYDNDPIQFIICESCGIVHCEPGGWLHIRRADDYVIFHPAFCFIRKGDFEKKEYSPPQYVKKKGVPYLHIDVYKQLRSEFPNFPDINNISKLTRGDALSMFQHDAPNQLLGDMYSGESDKLNSVIASSKGEYDDYVNLLRMLYLEDLSTDTEAIIKPVDPNDEKITLFYEMDRISEWELFIENGTTGLLLSKDFYLYLDNVIGNEHDNS